MRELLFALFVSLGVVAFYFRQFPPVSSLQPQQADSEKIVEPFFPLHLRHFQTCEEKPTCQHVLQVPPLNAENYTQNKLEKAWGKFRPSVDLYVRTGCQTASWVIWMLQSAEIFYPTFLGKIIVVLDANDKHTTEAIRALTWKHNVVIEYEPTPCLIPRVYNQLSYLRSYHWSEAEYILTIDSDCVFFTPVVPHLLFGVDQKPLLPTHAKFQRGMWDNVNYAMTQYALTPQPGHSMITQPVMFRRDTLVRFFAWMEKKHGKSLYALVDGMVDVRSDMHNFNWMTHVSTYVFHHERSNYDFLLMHATREPYRRFALHWKYENLNFMRGREQVIAAINGGLCLHFPDQFKCKPNERAYVEHYKFRYTTDFKLCTKCDAQDYKRADLKLKKALQS